MYEEYRHPNKPGFLSHIEFRTRADSSHHENFGRDFRGGRFSSDFCGNPNTVCFEITGTDHEYVSRSLEGGYSLQTEKIPAGYRLLLLKEGEVGQS